LLAFQYAFDDFTRTMPRTKRIVAWAAVLIQGYAIYALITRSFVWPLMWPRAPWVFAIGIFVFYTAYTVMNGLLASELVRKSKLEADQIAARKIQEALIPQKLEPLPGYRIESFYQPFRDVGGDYFDVIALKTPLVLIALADVSGKGMAAALLSSNIQALVRSISSADASPLLLAKRINQHLSDHTPSEFFATAVFLLLNRESGEIDYVNAGHNAPIVFGPGQIQLLQATGPPLGLFAASSYEARSAMLDPGRSLLVFTDGLTDSILGKEPDLRLQAELKENGPQALSRVRSLVEPKLNHDDVTILLVARLPFSPDHPRV